MRQPDSCFNRVDNKVPILSESPPSLTQPIVLRYRGLVGASSAVAAARVFSLLCAAVQLPALTAHLHPSEYSVVAVAIAIAAYFSLLSAEPVILAFERFPGSNNDRTTYRYALSRTGAYLCLAALLVVAGAHLLGYTTIAIGFVGWAIGISVNRLISLAWLMWEQPWQYAWNLMVGTGTRTAVLVGLILAGWDPLLSLGIAGAASAAAALLLSPRLHRAASGARNTGRPWSLGFGVNLALAQFAFTVLTNGSLLVLAAFVPSERVGSYAVMMQVSALTSGAVLGLALAVSYPPLRRAWDTGARASVQARLSALQQLCLVVAAAFVFTCFVGDSFLLRLVLPDEFLDQAVLAPLIVSTAVAAMGGMASWHHQLELRAGRVARRTIVASVIGLGLTVALTALFQESGAALGTAGAFLIYLAIMQSGTRLPTSTVGLAVTATMLTCISIAVPTIPADVIAYVALSIAIAITLVSIGKHRSIQRLAHH